MSELNRREVVSSLLALAALTAAKAEAQEGGAGMAPPKSGVYRFGALPEKKNAAGVSTRAVLKGTLPTGELLEVHETMLPAGQMPHPPHEHTHSEVIVIVEGQLQFVNEGVNESAGPGDVIYVASNRLHGMKNIGSTPARYVVVAVGK